MSLSYKKAPRVLLASKLPRVKNKSRLYNSRIIVSGYVIFKDDGTEADILKDNDSVLKAKTWLEHKLDS